ncbi:hypothetical protein CFC21_001354, partial [Triticum aestivum]
NNLPIGYPVLQKPGIPAAGQPHVNAMACGPPGYHIANGMPYHPIRMSSANGIMDNELPEAAHAATVFGTVSSEIAMSSSSGMSSNHLTFTPSELSEMDVDAAAVDTAIGADVANGGPLEIGLDSDFSLSDLSADLTNLGDLAALENYAGNPFMPSDSDILLDSTEHDDIVEYFVDAVDGPSQSDEEK